MFCDNARAGNNTRNPACGRCIDHNYNGELDTDDNDSVVVVEIGQPGYYCWGLTGMFIKSKCVPDQRAPTWQEGGCACVDQRSE